MTLEEKQEAILLLKKTQALIKNLNEQSRTDRSLYVDLWTYTTMCLSI
jgi:hypothetical protein